MVKGRFTSSKAEWEYLLEAQTTAEEIEEAQATKEHDGRMESLTRATAEEETECERLRGLLTDLQAAAAADTRIFSQTLHKLRAPDEPLPTEEAQRLHDAERRAEEERAAARLEEERLAEEVRVAAAKVENAAIAKVQRALTLAKGATMHRWDEYTRTLKACKLSVVAGGRCFQCTPIEADGSTDELPLLMPLHRIDFVAPSVAAGAFAAGTTPGHSWLYFTVGWSRQEESQPSGGAPESRVSAVGVHGGYRPGALSGSSVASASSSVVVRSPGEGPRVAHFACNSREECTAWIRGLCEASHEMHAKRLEQDSTMRARAAATLTADAAASRADEAAAEPPTAAPPVAWSVGALLWQQMGAMVREQARSSGKRPMDVLLGAVRMATADQMLVKLQIADAARKPTATALTAAPKSPGARAAGAPTPGTTPQRRKQRLARRKPSEE